MLKIADFLQNTVCGAFLPAVLFTAGIFFFLKLGRYVFSPGFFFSKIKEKNSEGRSTLSTLWLALGGTLGVGNICGVCAAIYMGGAGCVFWIWICALLSSVTKYAETVLAIHFRQKKADGSICGGAHSYIKNGLKSNSAAKIFCILCIVTAFTMGNITQVKVASDFAGYSMDIPAAVIPSLFFVSVLVLCLGKGKAINSFTSRAVPILCIFYTACCIGCIIVFRENIPEVTERIFREAFTPKAGLSGFLGYVCSPSLRLGITRGIMSNEAGCGTAPIAYASDENATPVKSGLLGVTEVLCDTLFLCTLTAYSVLLPGIPLTENSAESVITAFSSALGKAVVPLLSVSVFFFALASVAAWSFYAMQSAAFLGFKNKFHIFFASAYSLTAFLGCFVPEKTMWIFADLTISAMAVINTVTVLLLFGTVTKITKTEYCLYTEKRKIRKEKK